MADQPPGHTASQTVGPFLHIALADPTARFAVAEDADGAIVVRGRLTDGNGDPIPDGLIETWQVDGRFARSATDVDGSWEIHTTKPPAGPDARRHAAGAAPRRCRCSPRGLLDRVVTRVYFGDEEDANATDPTLRWSTRTAAACSSPRRTATAATASTSASRATMSPSSSPSDGGPFDFLVSRGPVAEATSSTAWLAAMIEVEAALAQAWAEVLAAPPESSRAIADACTVDRVDADAVFAAAELGGNPVIPLVPMLKELAGPAAAELVHRGATSQDILDTAAMLVVRRCSDLVRDRLVAVRAVGGRPRPRPRGDPDDRAHAAATRRADDVRGGRRPLVRRARRGPGGDSGGSDAELPLQLGGPVGDRAPFGPQFGHGRRRWSPPA